MVLVIFQDDLVVMQEALERPIRKLPLRGLMGSFGASLGPLGRCTGH